MNNNPKLNSESKEKTKNTYIPNLDGSIWLSSNNQNWGSHRRMALLQAIDETGSISAGAKKVGISYKGAWDAIETMNNATQHILVTRTLGGAGGGGAQLTPQAKQMVALYNSLNNAHSEFLKHLALISTNESPDLDLINNLVLSESKRNKISGKINHVNHTNSCVEINIDISNGILVTANLNLAQWQTLNLNDNDNVLAFIDADSILLAEPGFNTLISARNQLSGTIKDIEYKDGNANVMIALTDNIYITSLLTTNSVKRLNLEIGGTILAIFKSSSVTIGKPL